MYLPILLLLFLCLLDQDWGRRNLSDLLLRGDNVRKRQFCCVSILR